MGLFSTFEFMRSLIFAFTFISLNLFAQKFPKDWIGTYSGTMVIGSIERPNDSIFVAFDLHEIDKDSSWSYLMTFKSEKYGEIVKDYVIRKKAHSTTFLLDEKDGILIDMSLFDHSFYSVFELGETMYISTLSRVSDGIYFDLFIVPRTNPLISAPESEEEGNKIEVVSYKTTMHQTALLKKHE